MTKFGIIQGRLIKSPPGQLQWFPQEDWRAEHFLAASIGFSFVELIAERQMNPLNPVWTDEGINQIKATAAKAGLEVHSLCNDYVIDHSLINNVESRRTNLNLIAQGMKLCVKKYIVPLFEESELTSANASDYLEVIREMGAAAAPAGITICLESLLDGKDLCAFLKKIDMPNVKAVLDTGNRAALAHDLPEDISILGDFIAHVHIKDKNAKNENVLLGRGCVDFLGVCRALRSINYSGPFVFETQRGQDPVRTAKFNRDFIEFNLMEAAGNGA